MADRPRSRIVSFFIGWIGPMIIAAIILVVLIKYQGVLTPNF